MTAAEALNHDWLLASMHDAKSRFERPLFIRTITMYSAHGQLLSGHYINVAEKILKFNPNPSNIFLPIFLPVIGNSGFKLHEMILNATRFSLFVDSGSNKPKSNACDSSARELRQVLNQFRLCEKKNTQSILIKMLAPNMIEENHSEAEADLSDTELNALSTKLMRVDNKVHSTALRV